MPRDLWWDNLKRLSVRIMDSELKHLGSGLLYRHDENNVFALTACHVVNRFGQDDEFLVECQPNEGEESLELREKYTFRVKGSDVRSYYAPDTFPEKTYRENDAAVIKLDVEGRDWLTERKQVMFPLKDMDMAELPMAGYGYPKGKNSKNEEVISSSCERTKEAICCEHIRGNHRIEWELGISVSDPYSDDETGGWSGCVLVLAETEPMVLAGSAFAIYSGYKFGKFRGADLHYHRKLLETEFGITVNEWVFEEEDLVEENPVGFCDGLDPSLDNASFYIAGSRDTFIDMLISKAVPNKPMILCGPVGCGKSEVARAIADRYEIGGISYTIPYRLSNRPGEENMMASVLAASIGGKIFRGGNRTERMLAFKKRIEFLSCPRSNGSEMYAKWIIVDGLFHPRKSLDDLLREKSFNRLREMNNFLVCTTRCPARGNNRYEIPYLYENEDKHNCALLERMQYIAEGATITEKQFKEYLSLTGGNLLLADWTAKTLKWIDMDGVLYSLRTGDFSKENYWPNIYDDRTGKEAPLNVHICDLYDENQLEVEVQRTLPLLQFAEEKAITRRIFKILPPEVKKHADTLYSAGLFHLKETEYLGAKKSYYLDPVFKLACRCKGLSPDSGDLKALLSNMHHFYQTPESSDYRAVIEAYFNAASSYFDDEMRQWHNEILSA